MRRRPNPAISPLITLEIRARYLDRQLGDDGCTAGRRWHAEKELDAIEWVFAELQSIDRTYGEVLDLVAHRVDAIEAERAARPPGAVKAL